MRARVLLAGVASCAALAPAAHAAKRPLPAALVAVESGAEDAIDFAQAGQRTKLVATAAALRTAAERVGPSLRASGAPAGEVATLRRRAAQVQQVAGHGSVVELLLAANEVSALMPDLYSRFANEVPPATLKLDYLDREAQFRSMAGQAGRARAAVAQLGPTWKGLRPRVVAKGGRAQAVAYDRHVEAMRRLATAARKPFEREAAAGLEIVDELETVLDR